MKNQLIIILDFLKENLENQNIYSSKFSEIFEQMDIFQTENEDENKEENQENDQNNPSNDENQESNSDDQ